MTYFAPFSTTERSGCRTSRDVFRVARCAENAWLSDFERHLATARLRRSALEPWALDFGRSYCVLHAGGRIDR